MDNELGALIRERRLARGLTQKELGKLCSLSESGISDIERGRMGISVDLANALVAALRIPWYDFLTSMGYALPSQHGLRSQVPQDILRKLEQLPPEGLTAIRALTAGWLALGKN